MILSKRLESIAKLIDNCGSIADIGTDHGYIPVYAVDKQICKTAIASDINRGPVEKAKQNIKSYNLQDKIECRLGGGLSVLKPYEVDGAVIAGMGGNLIKDILEEGLDVFKTLKFVILQPVQNPEILREYIYNKGYRIIDEELCYEDGKYYEIIKITYDMKSKKVDDIYYEVSEKLVAKKHALLKEFISYKIDKYKKVLEYIKEETVNANKKKDETVDKINKLKELLLLCT